jgi:hypothetical protein
MSFPASRLPALTFTLICLAMLIHGPIAQPADYHRFADDSRTGGIPHAADVVSNLGFAVVGLLGWFALWSRRKEAAIRMAWPGYALFLIGLVLTAAGSGYYHLAPDDARLVWDRLPIGLACAGLLVGVRADTLPGIHAVAETAFLGLYAVGSVLWWYFGGGDLRPYLLLQILPLVLIPVWQALARSPRAERLWFAAGLGCYILAKFAELQDHEIARATAWLTGHTLKHLLATLAAALIVMALVRRTWLATPSRK